ncbi:MAG: glutathione S-transferase family protein [Alphaproteobacteria bacterium]|nr:glutathione S-transferase family protein [Alphaproteobacteria bacterium]
MLTLYYAPDNASLVLRLALEEASLPYETILVDRATNAQKAPDYLALNPTGRIPTLVTPQGVMAETAACLLWLTDSYPDANLGPSRDDARRGRFLRWLFYLSNTVHADLIRIFYPQRFVPAEGIDRHHETMTKQVLAHFEILDAAVRNDPSIFAPPSALALYLGPLLRWSALYPSSAKRWLDLATFPALKKLARSLEARPSVRTATLAEGLGDAPFTKPKPPNPPVGSAI